MKRKKKIPFDPKVFLLKVNGGRTASKYRKNQVVYRQGAPADAVYYIQTGKAKKTVVSEQGKGSQFWGQAISSAKDVWPGRRCVWDQWPL